MPLTRKAANVKRGIGLTESGLSSLYTLAREVKPTVICFIFFFRVKMPSPLSPWTFASLTARNRVLIAVKAEDMF